VPGLNVVETGAPGETSSTYIRGGNDEHTLVMMDGIPLNDPISTSRSYDYLDQLPLNNVQQIEVVRGPQSTLYGSNAMAGVVNIITKNGEGPLGGSASFEGGSYGTFHETASLNGGDSGGNFSLTGSRFDTAGFPSADQSFGNVVNNLDQNTNGSLKLGSNLTSNLSENVLVNYVQSHTNIDDGAGAGQDDPNNFADQKQLIVGSQTKWKLLNGDWEQVLNISFVDDNRNYTDTLNSFYPNSSNTISGYDGQSAQITWQNNLHLAPGETFVVGFQGSEEWAYENYNSGDGAYTDSVNALAQTGSIFVESQTQLSDRLYETLGGRFDSQTQYGNHGTYQAGLAYLIPETDTKLKATYGTGFLAPTLYQLYDPTYGNTALTPETSTGFDAGFEQAFGKNFLKVGATYFHEDFNNLIDFVYTNPNYPNGTYSNVDQAQSDGIESFIDFKGISHLDVKANYTFMNARDMSTGLPLPQRPQNQGDLDVFYQLDQLELGTSIMYVGPRSDNAFINGASTPVTLAEYFLVNLKASYSLDKNIKLFARVDNLFNQYYEEVYGYGTPGLSAYGGTKVSF
jgi:vitamin B12 transporter